MPEVKTFHDKMLAIGMATIIPLPAPLACDFGRGGLAQSFAPSDTRSSPNDADCIWVTDPDALDVDSLSGVAFDAWALAGIRRSDAAGGPNISLDEFIRSLGDEDPT